MNKQIVQFILMEFRLVLRNARTRKILLSSFMGGVSIICLILSLKQSNVLATTLGETSFFLSMMVMSGLFYFGYGQYNFSWNGGHFSLLSVSKIDWLAFYFAKAIFLLLMGLICILPSVLFILLFEPRIYLLFIVSGTIFNAGFLSFTSLVLSIYNTRRIDLASKGVFNNYQGMGKNQHLSGIPYFLTVSLLLFIGIYFKSYLLIWYISAGTGISILATGSIWIRYLTKKFRRHRYRILDGFNNN